MVNGCYHQMDRSGRPELIYWIVQLIQQKQKNACWQPLSESSGSIGTATKTSTTTLRSVDIETEGGALHASVFIILKVKGFTSATAFYQLLTSSKDGKVRQRRAPHCSTTCIMYIPYSLIGPHGCIRWTLCDDTPKCRCQTGWILTNHPETLCLDKGWAPGSSSDIQ